MRLNDLPAETKAVIAHMLRSEDNPQGIDGDAVLPEPTGFHVLCLQWVRGESVQVGSMKLILAESTRREDQYQGRLGVVLALGPDAYSDTVKFPSGPWVKVGDVVAWPALENASGRYAFGSGTLAGITDDRLVFRGCDPAMMVGR